MAKKKRKSTKKKAAAPQKPQHSLPSGFWAQVGAVFWIVLSILLVVSWFGVGGPVIEWIGSAAQATIGYGMYLLPVLLVYISVGVFRSEENRLPFVVKFASIIVLVWMAGLFGLLKTAERPEAGGFIGDTANNAMLSMVDPAVAALIYILLIVITALFITSTTPWALISRIADMMRSNRTEEDSNARIMKSATKADATKKAPAVKLNAGVPIADTKPEKDKKPSGFKRDLKGSVPVDKAAEEQSALVTAHDPNWKRPSKELLEQKEKGADVGDYEHNAEVIRETLSEFNIDVEMGDVNIGPKVTQYTLKPPSGVKLTRITALETNIALNLAAQSLRIEAPIPGQRAVGIEVPNRKPADVRLYGVLNSKQWRAAHEPLSFAIGKDISGQAVVGELNKMPHLLVAGQTGSGKSVMINTLLTSLLYRNSPSEMRLILVDPKQVEMAPYEDIPHLLTPVITEPEKAISAMKWAVNEMERRLKLMKEEGAREIATYNKKIKSKATKIAVADEDGNVQQHEEGAMPYIVIVIDELADLMMVAARDIEALIVRLAQKARAVGIHLVLATQSPRADVITGLMKANIPARIAFTVAQELESRIIMDTGGAEKLLGYGDMLMKTSSMPKPKRIQGAWVTDGEVVKVTDHLRMQSAPQYNDDVVAQPVQLNGKGGVVVDFGDDSGDDLFKDAVRVVIDGQRASTSYLQRRLKVGYQRAARIMEEMEEQGIIGPADGSRPREILISSMDELGGGSDDEI